MHFAYIRAFILGGAFSDNGKYMDQLCLTALTLSYGYLVLMWQTCNHLNPNS